MQFKWASDSWLTEDKWAHAGGCCLINSVIYSSISVGLIQLSFIAALQWSMAYTFCLGLAWEIKDAMMCDGFSYKDLVADVIGILISCVAILV